MIEKAKAWESLEEEIKDQRCLEDFKEELGPWSMPVRLSLIYFLLTSLFHPVVLSPPHPNICLLMFQPWAFQYLTEWAPLPPATEPLHVPFPFSERLPTTPF